MFGGLQCHRMTLGAFLSPGNSLSPVRVARIELGDCRCCRRERGSVLRLTWR